MTSSVYNGFVRVSPIAFLIMANKPKKKGEVGKVANHMSRNQAIRTLQISLRNFRRLCIYKGVYPLELKGKVVYHKKDIIFLSHDPLISFFRREKIYKDKVKKAKANNEELVVKDLLKSKPKLCLDHIIKQRYPTFDDAIRDLDDALSLVFTFADVPSSKHIPAEVIHKCQRLSSECFDFPSFII
ncbi:Pescadillo [Thelohanellus kitauei]|uniref:Pescadillo n=1 Tax=Thelohanellus kitauei TaxID=669202 RepID=A0A0C2MZ27_THEKT|nr:Pescadillo [Thelohanellus kitauei]